LALHTASAADGLPNTGTKSPQHAARARLIRRLGTTWTCRDTPWFVLSYHSDSIREHSWHPGNGPCGNNCETSRAASHLKRKRLVPTSDPTSFVRGTRRVNGPTGPSHGNLPHAFGKRLENILARAGAKHDPLATYLRNHSSALVSSLASRLCCAIASSSVPLITGFFVLDGLRCPHLVFTSICFISHLLSLRLPVDSTNV